MSAVQIIVRRRRRPHGSRCIAGRRAAAQPILVGASGGVPAVRRARRLRHHPALGVRCGVRAPRGRGRRVHAATAPGRGDGRGGRDGRGRAAQRRAVRRRGIVRPRHVPGSPLDRRAGGWGGGRVPGRLVRLGCRAGSAAARRRAGAGLRTRRRTGLGPRHRFWEFIANLRGAGSVVVWPQRGWSGMGLFYSNLTVYRPARSALQSELRRLKRAAFLSPTLRGHTVVFDKAMDEQDSKAVERLGKAVTKALSCSALAAVLHDDNVLYLWLFHSGRIKDRYDSCPSYFDPRATETEPPAGGNAKALCEAFGRTGRADRVEELLRADLPEDELPAVPGEFGRHAALATELGMPPFVAG